MCCFLKKKTELLINFKPLCVKAEESWIYLVLGGHLVQKDYFLAKVFLLSWETVGEWGWPTGGLGYTYLKTNNNDKVDFVMQ